MTALEYVNYVIRSGQLKAKSQRSLIEDKELAGVCTILRQYEKENPTKAALAMNLLINDALQKKGLTH
jgi:hypothetical protein